MLKDEPYRRPSSRVSRGKWFFFGAFTGLVVTLLLFLAAGLYVIRNPGIILTGVAGRGVEEVVSGNQDVALRVIEHATPLRAVDDGRTISVDLNRHDVGVIAWADKGLACRLPACDVLLDPSEQRPRGRLTGSCGVCLVPVLPVINLEHFCHDPGVGLANGVFNRCRGRRRLSGCRRRSRRGDRGRQ